jgi:hypothetical protein
MEMKRRLMMLAGVGFVLAALFVLWYDTTHSIYAKLLLGNARVLTSQVAITVAVDDRELRGVRCFAEPGEFRNHRSKGLVLWVDDPHALLGRHVLVVDLDRRSILLPNFGLDDYKLLGNKRLMQSDSGAVGVAFGDSKLDERDPDFQQSGNLISFTIPPVLDLPAGRWSVRIDANQI